MLLWLVPAVPLLGFLTLSLFGRFFSKRAAAVLGTGAVGASWLLSLKEVFSFSAPVHTVLWDWICVANLCAPIGLYLDTLSLTMMAVVTTVSFLILIYYTEFMADDKGYARFFAYMNLFVGSMLALVLADNLLGLYLGWEGVGLCSYLLIGFWYEDSAHIYAANKAFIITRIGDIFLLLGIIALFWQSGTVSLPQLLSGSTQVGLLIPLLFVLGAVGKSAQLPLQTWLPDAMAGPTPVSALIHAATMVAAGVYLLARMHVFFDGAPQVRMLIAAIGAATLLLAGCSALTQRNIKRVLAYSTMSQVGYMFLGLGVGACDAAIFHFMTHAFFKALLFLSAGVIITALGQEEDLFRMGGLRKELPVTFWVFLIGASALSAIPWVDAGFYSKDAILEASSGWLYAAGLAGSLLTALYTFRMVFLIFFGPCHHKAHRRPGLRMTIPMVLLAAGSLFSGGSRATHAPLFQALLPLFGIGAAAWLFWLRPRLSARWEKSSIALWWQSGWGFDALYERLAAPLLRFFRWNADGVDVVDAWAFSCCAAAAKGLLWLQTGGIRWYAMTMAAGAILLISIVVWA